VKTLERRHFVDHALDLSDKHVLNCVFDGCVLTLNPGPFYIESNHFKDCLLLGDGWPNAIVARNF
jgi:hypothetical protein